MEYVKLGRTGLDVSRVCLGCMTYGEPQRGNHPWTLEEAESRPLIRKAIDLGINFFDTANVYSDGSSEEIVGRALKEFTQRDAIVLATKVHGRMHARPNGMGLSRKSILAQIDHSLRRLGTDYVDLYQIHRWDPHTPIEETLEAMHDVVKAGKARYIGASSMYAWQFSKALYLAEQHGWTRFATMQNHYNLLYREEEREMMPLCQDQGIGVIPWSPLARGRLTRDWDDTSERMQTDEFGKTLYTVPDADRRIVEAVATIASAYRKPRSRWPGSRSSRSSPRRSSAPPNRNTSMMPSPPCRCSSPRTKSQHWKSTTCRTRWPGISEPGKRGWIARSHPRNQFASNVTPVSCSDTSHRRADAAASRAFGNTFAGAGAPFNSNAPSGP
jgi:aryl-alcohol dehydrogenase-like predicted oxidoreductase